MKRTLSLIALTLFGLPAAWAQSPAFTPITPPAWVNQVTRMTFCTFDDLDRAAKAGVQVVQTNVVWPYFPLKRDGGPGLTPKDAEALRKFSTECHKRGMKLVLGLPPFPPVDLVKAHPDWRVDPDGSGKAYMVEPKEDNLSTRIPCNQGPWRDYLIEVCAELLRDYDLDGYSFDGNYHPGLCFCPACKGAYKRNSGGDIPKAANLDDIAYRKYLVWRGERLEDHYRKLQTRLKGINPNAALINWTVNAGRYGHLLFSPRAMPTRLNLLFDGLMQEWWLDETNQGSSIAPSFGAAYLRAVGNGRMASSEPYMMSRGNPYGTTSFPPHEQITRALLAITHGNVLAEAMGWPGHRDTAMKVYEAVAARDNWITNAQPMPWAAMLVSEQTRQFYAYKDIARRYLPHLFGAFRAAMEEHLPLTLINDWDVNDAELAKYRVLVLPNAAALSEPQNAAIRRFVQNGGGLVATCETSLCDELGRPRQDFGLANVFGVHHLGRPADLPASNNSQPKRPELDANFAATLPESYWQQRTGISTLTWTDTPLMQDAKLAALLPFKEVTFKGPQVAVSAPANASETAIRFRPEGWMKEPLPGVVVRNVGKGRVIYMAAGIDAALWSYAYPYQRILFAKAIKMAAEKPFPITVQAPMCVQSTFFEQKNKEGRRFVIHLFNGIDTAANHGVPGMDVPLREESVPIHGIHVRLKGIRFSRIHIEPGKLHPKTHSEGGTTVVEVPPLAVHSMVIVQAQ